jgi:hypothetical protein
MSPSSLCITFETTFSAKEPSASSSSVQLRYRDASAVSQQSERDSVDASSQVCFCVSWKQLLAVILLARPRPTGNALHVVPRQGLHFVVTPGQKGSGGLMTAHVIDKSRKGASTFQSPNKSMIERVSDTFALSDSFSTPRPGPFTGPRDRF